MFVLWQQRGRRRLLHCRFVRCSDYVPARYKNLATDSMGVLQVEAPSRGDARRHFVGPFWQIRVRSSEVTGGHLRRTRKRDRGRLCRAMTMLRGAELRRSPVRLQMAA